MDKVFAGATKQEWQIAITNIPIQDILPYVADKSVPKHSESKIKNASKVPTIIKSGGYVGLFKWQKHRTTKEEILEWSSDNRYGICVVARTVFAIDIDLEDCQEVSEIIENFIIDELGQSCVIRSRSNSNKCMYLYKLVDLADAETIKKSIIKFENGAVEFLFHSQMYCLAGNHISGGRYQLEFVGDKFEIPSLTTGQLKQLHAKIMAVASPEMPHNFSVLSSGIKKSKPTQHTEIPQDITLLDEDAQAVFHSEAYLGRVKSGAFMVTCPYKHTHTSVDNITDCLYYPATEMTSPHIHCFHTSHGVLSVEDLYKSIGHTSTKYKKLLENIELPPSEDTQSLPSEDTQSLPSEDTQSLPSEKEFTPTDVFNLLEKIVIPKYGEVIAPNIHNLHQLMIHADVLNLPQFRYDTFRSVREYKRDNKSDWKTLSDDDITNARRIYVNRVLTPMQSFGAKDFTLFASATAKDKSYDSGVEFCKTIPEWDKVNHIGKLAKSVSNSVDDIPVAEAALKYLIAFVYGRLATVNSYVKADAIPILVGSEGIGKSTLCRELAFSEDAFTDSFSFTLSNADLARVTSGKSIIEFSELDGMSKVAGSFIKQYITRTYDEWIPKYKENSVKVFKRYMLIGTSNNARFLTSDLGIRRWLPFKVSHIDIDWIRENKMKLYAQAKHLFLTERDSLYIKAVEVCRNNIGGFVVANPRKQMIENYLQSCVKRGLVEIDLTTICFELFSIPMNKVGKGILAEVSETLDELCTYDNKKNTWIIDTSILDKTLDIDLFNEV